MTTTIKIQEANYVDPRAGNDKFYRVFVIGSAWVTQYGRNGTIGTFTKLVEETTPEAALKAAEAKMLSKIKKGYDTSRSGEVTSHDAITSDNLALLDDLAAILPLGAVNTIVSAPVNAVSLAQPPEADLTKTIEQLLRQDIYKNYCEKVEDAVPALPTRPMLAAVATAEEINDAMEDPRWVAQYKYDGDRVVIEITDGEIRVLNRQGEAKIRNVGAAHLQPFTALHKGSWIFDGEIVGRTLVIFDLIAANDGRNAWVCDAYSFALRYKTLSVIAKALGIPTASSTETAAVVLAPISQSLEEKFDFLATAIAEQREGIILRHLHSPYQQGRRSTTLLKHKLIKDADVVVTALHTTKDSATLSVHQSDGTLIEVGAASTIGKGAVSIGDVWVVTFLYVTDPVHPRLFQPRLVRRRDDKAAGNCTIDQFADAGTNKIV